MHERVKNHLVAVIHARGDCLQVLHYPMLQAHPARRPQQKRCRVSGAAAAAAAAVTPAQQASTVTGDCFGQKRTQIKLETTSEIADVVKHDA